MSDLSEYGCCILTNVLSAARIALLKQKMDEQYEAEEALGELTPERGLSNKIVIPNLVNKGQHYLESGHPRSHRSICQPRIRQTVVAVQPDGPHVHRHDPKRRTGASRSRPSTCKSGTTGTVEPVLSARRFHPGAGAAPWYFPAAIDGPQPTAFTRPLPQRAYRSLCQPAVSLPLKAGFGTPRAQSYRASKTSVVGFLLSTLAAATGECSGRDKPRPAGKCRFDVARTAWPAHLWHAR